MNTLLTRRRLILILTTPVVVSAVFTLLITLFSVAPQLRTNATSTAAVMVDQLASLSAVFMVNSDVLALNVLLDEQVEKHPIAFAAIYSSNNQLLAQSGSRNPDRRAVTTDITWQNESLGHLLLQVDVDEGTARLNSILLLALMVHAAMAIALTGVAWFAGDFVYLWLTAPPPLKPINEPVEPDPEQLSLVPQELTLLLVRCRPARLVDHEGIARTARLYRGKINHVSDEELLLEFQSDDQVMGALCCGTLLREIFNQNPRIRYGLVLDIDAPDAAEAQKKKVRYLATLGPGKLLLSEHFFRHVSPEMRERFGINTFTSSLASTVPLYTGNQCDDLLRQQLKQLT